MSVCVENDLIDLLYSRPFQGRFIAVLDDTTSTVLREIAARQK